VAIKPIGDKLLVELVVEDEQKVGTIIVPDTAKEKPQIARVIAAGEGKKDGKELIPMTVKVGDKVLFGKYSGTEIKYQGIEYLLLSESDILAIVD
jgi:chaperonin GroES